MELFLNAKYTYDMRYNFKLNHLNINKYICDL